MQNAVCPSLMLVLQPPLKLKIATLFADDDIPDDNSLFRKYFRFPELCVVISEWFVPTPKSEGKDCFFCQELHEIESKLCKNQYSKLV